MRTRQQTIGLTKGVARDAGTSQHGGAHAPRYERARRLQAALGVAPASREHQRARRVCGDELECAPILVGNRFGIEYIPGQSYPHTLESTFDSGRVLSLYHKLLHDFRSEWQPASGSYHAAPSVEQVLKLIPNSVQTGDTAELLNRIIKNRSVLVIEHDMKFVEDIAHKVTVLHQGQILSEGTMEKVQNDPTVIEVYLGH